MTAANDRNSRRGFGSMDQERQRSIASEGGRAAHQRGTAHEFSPEEARAAGRKGGEAVSQDRNHMAAIGRKGGEASRGGQARARQANRSATAAGQAGSAGGGLDGCTAQQARGQEGGGSA
jgi:general stress protein YciG